MFIVDGRVVCNINGQILGTSECNGFGPGMKVDNMVILLTPTPDYFASVHFTLTKAVHVCAGCPFCCKHDDVL